MLTALPPTGWRRLIRACLPGVVAAALVAVTTMQSGCVEDIRTVNRTSPYKMDKRHFEGVWLYLQTTIDVPFSSAVSFVGEQPFGATTKIIFDIQENWLIAYPIIETIEDSERDWKTHSIRKYWDPDARDEFIEMYVGPPVARWPIEAHFDVVRNYNPFNGAQSNELTENMMDRPWYQRDYFRVAWHRQGIQDFFFSLKGGNDAYFVGEERPGHPDELEMDQENGYFAFVVRSLAWSVAQNRCNIYDLSQFDCARAEVKVRHSFRKYDHRRDYEPVRYHNDEQMDLFGYFLTERHYYDYDWGPTYRGMVSYANRWNLWDKTYDFDKPRDDDGEEMTIACFADRDCDRHAGYRCQKEVSWFSDGYCAKPVAKPFAERGLRPIIFHLSAHWHEDYLVSAYEAADAWDDVFKDAVAWLLFYEEKNVAVPQACRTHADCANGGLLADRTFRFLEGGIHCHTDAQCGAGVCGADSFCGTVRSCDASSPCAVGQTCSGGTCQDDAGQTVLRRTASNQLRSSSLVFAGDRQMGTHDYFPTSVRQDLPAGHTWVRFVNLAEGQGAIGLSIGNVTITGGEANLELDLDPADPATTPWIASVPAGNGLSVAVTQGGAELATTRADVLATHHYLVVYNGQDVIVVGETYNRTSGGMRLIHAGRTAGNVDFGIEGAKLAENISYGISTPYLSAAGAYQRTTVSRAGGQGEFTCYQADTLGYCTGWGADFTDADRDRVRQIKQELPAMFVLCENIHDPIAASETITDPMTTFSDARYTRPNGYNPCGDATRVAKPTELKKQGDARYSFFYWVNEPQRSGPLGYGPSEADPETGEIIVANSNIYGGAIHTYAQYASDLLDLVTGDLTLDRVASGEYIREYLAALEDPEREAIYRAFQPASGPSNHDHAHHHGGWEIDEHAAVPGFDLVQDNPDLLRANKLGIKPPVRMVEDWEFPELIDFQLDPQRFGNAVMNVLPPIDSRTLHNRLNLVKDTHIGTMMTTDEVRWAVGSYSRDRGLDPGEIQDMLQPTTWTTKHAIQTERDRMKILSKDHCLFMGEFIDEALYGLAQELKNSGLTKDEQRLFIGNRILRGVLEHEIGHTIGLRHNFSGSTDVFNFFDEYYEIREKELILCQDDSWCDQITGEACAISRCVSDGDCPPGSLCGTGGQCSSPDALNPNVIVPTGACAYPVDGLTCVNNRQCGDNNVCYQNRCYAPRSQFAPRFWLTDTEKAQKRTEYQYTTIMDYGARVNSDIQSLGKYDYAAIRYGYAQLVDTYADVSKIDKRVADAARLTGNTPAQYSGYRNTRFWPTRGQGFFHPFNFINNYIGPEENLKRTPVPYHLVKNQRDMVTNSVREHLDVHYIQVPYGFCSDEFRGNMGCYYFDQGIDMGEMAEGATEMLMNYYVYDAFKRERLFYGNFGNPIGYYLRMMDRYFRILGDVGMFYALYDSLLFRYAWYQNWKTSPLGGRAMEQAAFNAFATLKDVIASPAPGSYKFDPAMDAYVNVSRNGIPDADVVVPFGIGRFPYTQFGADLGYYYWEHPMWFGSFWEKLAAIVTLTDSTAYFVDTFVGEQIGIGIGTSLGYNTAFPNELSNFVGGIVSGDLDFFAGRAINGRYVPPSLSAELDAFKPVEPSINNFTMKLYAAVYGLAFIPAGFDPQFIDRLAIFLDGEARQYQTSDVALLEEVRFQDPIGGKVYVAYSTNYGAFGQAKLDVAANIVQQAQDLADDWEMETNEARKAQLLRQLIEVREVLDLLRQLYQVYGSSTLGL